MNEVVDYAMTLHGRRLDETEWLQARSIRGCSLYVPGLSAPVEFALFLQGQNYRNSRTKWVCYLLSRAFRCYRIGTGALKYPSFRTELVDLLHSWGFRRAKEILGLRSGARAKESLPLVAYMALMMEAVRFANPQKYGRLGFTVKVKKAAPARSSDAATDLDGILDDALFIEPWAARIPKLPRPPAQDASWLQWNRWLTEALWRGRRLGPEADAGEYVDHIMHSVWPSGDDNDSADYSRPISQFESLCALWLIGNGVPWPSWSTKVSDHARDLFNSKYRSLVGGLKAARVVR